MPNTREKLIELLEGAFEKFIDDPYYIPDEKEFADHLIANGVTVQEWIPVTERLPNPYTSVLTYRQSFDKHPSFIKIDKMILLDEGTPEWAIDFLVWKTVVTHWMPLPQPPKGE